MTTSPTEQTVYEPLRIERVVVGVDGSAGSLNALRWALREARAHEAALRAIFAWQYPAPRTARRGPDSQHRATGPASGIEG